MKSWLVVASLLTSSLAFGQKPAFEVVSIKPAEPSPANMIRMNSSNDAGMARYTNFSVRDLIRVAYRVKDFQIEGPDSMANLRFNVAGKLPEGAPQDQIPEMLQAMLAERFNLSLHRATSEHAIYALIAGKNGPKLKPVESAAGPARPGGMMVTVDDAGAHLKAPAATLGQLGEMISRFSERPIVDMTGIQGQYEFDLVFSPEVIQNRGGEGGGQHSSDAPGSTAGSIYDSVQRYGLKLEPRKAPIEMLIVDRVEAMPSEN